MTPRAHRDPPIGPAPADARPHRPWPIWKKITAYALLGALACASIWYIDLKAHGSATAATR